MCVVSMVTDHYHEKWIDDIPLPEFNPFETFKPKFTPQVKTTVTITKEQWDEYQELKRKAAEYDTRNNEPHCQKPDISEWEAVIIKVLRERGILTEDSE